MTRIVVVDVGLHEPQWSDRWWNGVQASGFLHHRTGGSSPRSRKASANASDRSCATPT